jgi:hypothetical protein
VAPGDWFVHKALIENELRAVDVANHPGISPPP